MSVEGGPSGGGSGGGPSGGIGGGVGAGVSVGPAISAGLSMSVGIEASGLARAASVSGLARMDIGPAFGAAPVVVGPVNEGPVNLAALKLTVPLGEIKFNSSSLSVPGVLAEAESIISQAQKPAVSSPVIPANAGIKLNESRSELDPALRRDDKRVEPMITPFVVPNIAPKIFEFPKPQVGALPALEPAVKAGPQTGSGVANETEPAATPQPVLQEVEEEVSERVTAKQIDIVEEEEIEESRLKNVVDEEVLNTRIKEFSSAVDIVGAEVEEGSEEIDGGKIVKLVPAETEDRRSGLVKKQGPDGSRVETIEEIAFRKFGSVKEAKENIMAIIVRKVPVKRAKEGTEAGYEAVVRVLKYFFSKPKPVEQMITRIVKKQKVLTKEGQKPSQIVPVAKPEATGSRIENLGLAEVFPKH